MRNFLSQRSFVRAGHWSAALATTVLSLGLMGGAKPLVTQPAIHADEVLPQQAQSQAELTEFNVEPASDPAGELLHSVTTDVAAPLPLPVPIDPSTLPIHQSRTIWVQVTAYCSCKKCCGPLAHGITASGRSIQYNGGLFVAADTKLLPFGTKLIVPGYANEQPVEVIDRGGAIKGHHIDLFFPTHEQAKQWGVRWMQITIVD